MDILQDYLPLLTPLLRTLLTTLHPLLAPALHILHTIRATLLPLLLPLLHTASRLAADAPLPAALALALLAAYLTLRLVGLLRRALAFGVRVALALLFYGALAAAAAVVYQRGLEETGRDVLRWGGVVADVWASEYRRWEEVQRQAGAGEAPSATPRRGWR